tara:strand:- start:329 stop:580 length:252 start_codon:yes stop_codon:yes gene_type:complete
MQIFKLNAKMKIRMFKYYSRNLINLEKQKIVLLTNIYNLENKEEHLNSLDFINNKIETYNYRLIELKNNTWGNTNSRDKKGVN